MPLQVLLQQFPFAPQAAPLGSLHVPACMPEVQQTWAPEQVTAVPPQTPFVQTSFAVQTLLSLQAAPFGLFVSTQALLTQVACLHWLVGVGQSAAVWQHPAIVVCTHVWVV